MTNIKSEHSDFRQRDRVSPLHGQMPVPQAAIDRLFDPQRRSGIEALLAALAKQEQRREE